MVKFDKHISIGNVLTIVAFAGSMVWTASQVFARFEAIEKTADFAYDNSLENEEDVQSIQVRLAAIETKIDEGFKGLERLIKKKK
tara:strand:- start:819 stop:1073 length:255 start_codon:yes stop_codon:yes gene_type:complete